jgi:DNA-binding NtrC family response regulator
MAKATLEGCEVLVLEDEPLLRKRTAAFLEKQGASVTTASTIAEARSALDGLPLDFALLDLGLPDGDGLDLLRERRIGPATSTIIMTAQGGIESAVEAMRLGAADFLAKPVEPEALLLVMARARREKQRSRIDEFKAQKRVENSQVYLGGAMQGVQKQLDRVIAADKRLAGRLPPVLIHGETGTGKTTFARWLHENGARASRAFIDVNCSALPEQLAESELFGHERGSFTDAKEARIGLFEAADGGTLFLDEVPSLSPNLQAKLLKAVEEGRIRRVGSSRDIAVDVRLIAATNRDMGELVQKGEFREDLLHRLDLLRVNLPPLREWGPDIVPLAEHLLAKVAAKYRLKGLEISPEGRRRVAAWRWPGNVRELSHEIEREVVLSMGGEPLDFLSLPVADAASASAPNGTPQGWFVESYRYPEDGSFNIEAAVLHMIHHALVQTNGNVTAAARLLGVPRDYLRYRLKQDKPTE